MSDSSQGKKLFTHKASTPCPVCDGYETNRNNKCKGATFESTVKGFNILVICTGKEAYNPCFIESGIGATGKKFLLPEKEYLGGRVKTATAKKSSTKETKPPVNSSERDRLHRNALSHFSLDDTHLEFILKTRDISIEAIKAAGFFSLPAGDQGKISYHKFKGIPGLMSQGKLVHYDSKEKTIFVPVHNVEGQWVGTHRCRSWDGDERKGWVSQFEDGYAAKTKEFDENPVAYSNFKNASTDKIAIVEGIVFKHMIVSDKLGYPTIGVNSCAYLPQKKTLANSINYLKAKEIHLFPDADWYFNVGVNQGFRNFVDWLCDFRTEDGQRLIIRVADWGQAYDKEVGSIDDNKNYENFKLLTLDDCVRDKLLEPSDAIKEAIATEFPPVLVRSDKFDWFPQDNQRVDKIVSLMKDGKKNIVEASRTGSGKSYCVKELADTVLELGLVKKVVYVCAKPKEPNVSLPVQDRDLPSFLQIPKPGEWQIMPSADQSNCILAIERAELWKAGFDARDVAIRSCNKCEFGNGLKGDSSCKEKPFEGQKGFPILSQTAALDSRIICHPSQLRNIEKEETLVIWEEASNNEWVDVIEMELAKIEVWERVFEKVLEQTSGESKELMFRVYEPIITLSNAIEEVNQNEDQKIVEYGMAVKPNDLLIFNSKIPSQSEIQQTVNSAVDKFREIVKEHYDKEYETSKYKYKFREFAKWYPTISADDGEGKTVQKELPPGRLIRFLEAFATNEGAFTASNDKLYLNTKNEYLIEQVNDAKFNLFLDATFDNKILNLFKEKAHKIAVAFSPMSNLNIISIQTKGTGKRGNYKSEGCHAQLRADVVVQGLIQRGFVKPGKFAYCCFKGTEINKWINDRTGLILEWGNGSRGDNSTFEQGIHDLVIVGQYRGQQTAFKSRFIALTGGFDDKDFRIWYKEQETSELIQAIGRLRSQLIDEKCNVYLVNEDAEVKKIAALYGAELLEINENAITNDTTLIGEDGEKQINIQSKYYTRYKIAEAIWNSLGAGTDSKKITQIAIATATGIPLDTIKEQFRNSPDGREIACRDLVEILCKTKIDKEYTETSFRDFLYPKRTVECELSINIYSYRKSTLNDRIDITKWHQTLVWLGFCSFDNLHKTGGNKENREIEVLYTNSCPSFPELKQEVNELQSLNLTTEGAIFHVEPIDTHVLKHISEAYVQLDKLTAVKTLKALMPIVSIKMEVSKVLDRSIVMDDAYLDRLNKPSDEEQAIIEGINSCDIFDIEKFVEATTSCREVYERFSHLIWIDSNPQIESFKPLFEQMLNAYYPVKKG
jgi:hypothetical protein